MAIETPIDRVARFLAGVSPFDTLPEAVLVEVAAGALIEYFPVGTKILERKGEPARFVYIIQTGAVRVYLPPEKHRRNDLLVDMRAEGEMLGVYSLLDDAPPRLTVEAVEDTLCYLIKAEAFNRLLSEHQAFARHFTRSLRESTSRFYRSSGPPAAEPEPGLNTVQVREVMRDEVLTCRPFTPVLVAARGMARRGVGSVVVVDDHRRPVGIITNTDLRDKIVALDRSAETVPAAEIMSRRPKSVGPLTYLDEAAMSMIRFGLSHLVVVDADERLVGVISEQDVLAATGSTPTNMFSEIDRAKNLNELIDLRRRADRVLSRLLHRGGSARHFIGLITELNDRLTRRLIRLKEQEVGRPPVAYCWLALGSEGRREQTLRTDQDNAIVFANVPPKSLAEVQVYFLELGEAVVGGLERLGFPRCQGGVMASNPQWCQPEGVWRDYFRGWIKDPDPQKLRLATIFFDFRPLKADAPLTESLSEVIAEAIKANRLFLRHLAATALFNRPPLGFFRKLVVEKSGENKNKLNLKLSGLTPIVDGARVIALDRGLTSTNTLDRLAGSVGDGWLTERQADDLADSYGFINLLRTRRHLDQLRQGLSPDNYLDPADLNRLQRQTLKEAFSLISGFQEMLEQRYQVRFLR